MEIFSVIVTSSLVSSLITIFVSNALTNRRKDKEKDYETKMKVYVEVSNVLNRFMVNKNEKRTVAEIHKILGELFMIAPDKVIYGIRRIWEDKHLDNKVKGDNIAKLWLEMRKDLIPNTKLTIDDFFNLDLP